MSVLNIKLRVEYIIVLVGFKIRVGRNERNKIHCNGGSLAGRNWLTELEEQENVYVTEK